MVGSAGLKLGKWVLLASLLAGTAACGGRPDGETATLKAPAFDDLDGAIKIRENNPVSKEFLVGMNRFGLTSASRVLGTEGDNVLYSPYSLYVALALAASGAEGATREEMLAVLEAKGMSREDMSRETGNLIRLLHTDNEVGRLKTANSLWIKEGHSFKKDYEKLAARDFYSSLHLVDFNRKETAEAMSRWVKEHTSGQIAPEIQVNPQEVLAIFNTVDFKDEWTDRFETSWTMPDNFYPEGENPVAVDYMNRTFFLNTYVKAKGYTSVSLGLKNKGAMTFVLPDKGVKPETLLATPEQVKALLGAADQPQRRVTLKLPKFEYDSRLDLNETLQALGMKTPFTGRADFGSMTDTAVFISQVMQDTHIAIDENGVEAAAFTQIHMAGGAQPNGEPVELVLDRPFLYSITAPNGTLLFAGICRNP